MTSKAIEPLTLDRVNTPIGTALLIFDGNGRLRALDWEDHQDRMLAILRIRDGANASVTPGRGPVAVVHALERYFSGDITAIDAIQCRTAGTPFQEAVWAALREIPAGRTSSYGALARKIGAPKAVRAVGHANGSNPISVVVPCHRVIGTSGALTGYGGGLDRKRWLLTHEGATFAD